MNERTRRLTARFAELGLDAAIVTSYENRRYLSGFSGSNATLLVFDKRQLLFTDFRYTEQAEHEAPAYEIVIFDQFRGFSQTLAAMAAEHGLARVGFESAKATVSWLYDMQRAMPGVEFVPMPDEIDRLRMCKDEGEIEAIKRAQAVTDAAFADILSRIRPGVSEIDIMSELNYFMAKHGASPAFDTIVAGGPNGAMPHAQPTARKLQSGDFLTLDFGAKLAGYCSDMTRTVAIGTPSDEMAKVYDIVLEAQRRALDKIAPGVLCNDVDIAARGYIADKGYGECFGHGLGHGFGLLIHEEPRFSPHCSQALMPGMCLSVEPGIYIFGKFGVRIEDTVCIDAQGYLNFTHSPKELIIL